MDELNAKAQCAHHPCTCAVEPAEQFCSSACRDDETGADLAAPARCRCHHPQCEAR